MIAKERTIPLKLQKLEALLRRLPHQHAKRDSIAEKLYRLKAGYRGEREIDYPLSFLQEDTYWILHDLRLFDGSHYFQIDTLVISQRFALILEVKNFKGVLVLEESFQQMIRIIDEKKEGFPNPVFQLERQKNQLKKWFAFHHIAPIPIEGLVVISRPQTILQSTPNHPHIHTMIHAEKIPFIVREMSQLHSKKKWSKNQVYEAIQLTLNEHAPLDIDILEQEEILPIELIKGVQCPFCDELSMKRGWGRWDCLLCYKTSKTAHYAALNDYKLLISHTISNQQARNFLCIESPIVTRKLLLTSPAREGTNRHRIYHLT
ncbi:nuclease-related domain-containing protein [Priestia koreensis]|uniref:nuclease-related domain-containing protein n=1 Tax=Priestia koreensis TaxID=284581 RepID=UPI0034576E4E